MGFAGLASTELALTDKRLLGKTGTTNFAVAHKQIETAVARRSLLGMLFNYGTITISGKGVSAVKFRGIIGVRHMIAMIDQATETAIFGNFLKDDGDLPANDKKHIPRIESPPAPKVELKMEPPKQEAPPPPPPAPEPVAQAKPQPRKTGTHPHTDPDVW